MKIENHDQVGGTMATYIASKAYVELCESGLVDKTVNPINYDDDKYICCKERGAIIGLLVYRLSPEWKEITEIIGWVDAKYRRKGVYGRLYGKLRSIRDKKYPDYKIDGATHPGNKAMLALMKRRTKISINFVDYPKCTV